MKKKAWISVLCFILVAQFAIGLTGCDLFGKGDSATGGSSKSYVGTYYKYADGAADKDSWIKLEKNKWSDSDETSGRLESKNGKVYCYTEIFGEEELVFFGTVKDGVFSWTVDESEPYTKYYKIGSYEDNSGNGGNGDNNGNGGNSGSSTGNSVGTKGLKYSFIEDLDGVSGYCVWGFEDAEDSNIVIPSEYNGKPVIAIFPIDPDFEFDGSEAEAEAWEKEIVKKRAKITGISIPKTVIYYELSSFMYCNLTNIQVDSENPNYKSENNCILTKDGKTLVTGCKTSVIPNSVTTIDWGAFAYCPGLTSITIPSSVTEINLYAFRDCDNLTRIEVDSNNATYKSENNCILTKDGLTLVLGYKTSVIPNGVTSIGDYAFSDCTGLTSITIPASVTSIGRCAFYDCTGLTSITIPASVTSIGDYAFDGTAWYDNQPDGVVYAGKVLYEYKGTMLDNTEIVIKEGTKAIAEYAFYDCDGLTGITIPDSVTSIGDSAFDGCPIETATIPTLAIDYIRNTKLKTVVITSGEDIGNSAFYGYTGLTSITIPDSVTSIGRRAFHGCSGLTSITIPDSVTSIGDDAFYGTAWYDNQPDGVVYVGKVLYRYKGTMSDYTEIVIKEGTREIGNYAFYCSELTSITIPASVTSIGDYAFVRCELRRIDFQGTKVQWNSISKGNSWNGLAGNYTIYCTDGELW